jgi:hypothetical protein
MQPENQTWDPGRVQNQEERNKLIKINVPVHIYLSISTAMASAVDVSEESNMEESSRTELDSNANMPVVGRNACIISDRGRLADVNPFTPDYESMVASIVDAAVLHECPYNGQTHMLVLRNALHAPMKNNLVPPFVTREAGTRVNDTPNIQTSDPTKEDHSIYFPETDFRIPLSLWGVFSYFVTSKPTAKQMMEAEDVCMLTPSRMNPHCDAHATNEENMLDWEGKMMQQKDRVQILLSDVQEDVALAASVQVSSTEAKAIDNVLDGDSATYNEEAHPCWKPVPRAADKISSMLASVSPALDDQTLYGGLAERAKLGKFKASIGSTSALGGEHLTDDDSATQPLTDNDLSDSDLDEDDNQTLDQLHDSITKGEIDLDEIRISAAHAMKSKGVDPAHLSKIWRIDLKTAERTLEVVLELNKRVDDPTLSRNYGTNDRMLRHKRIAECFFMDAFFATKKAGKSSQGHTCCQLFVADKGFAHVVLMKSNAKVLQAVKEFAKEIGAPEAIMCDMARKQMLHALKRFCHEIGATLKVLEEGTPWLNKAKLHVGLIKEAVRKDMKESDCPLAFWDRCVERRACVNNLTAKNIFTLHGSNPHAALTGEEVDMSNLCQYKWYDWCYFRE